MERKPYFLLKRRKWELLSYLVGAGDARSVEHREKELRCEDNNKPIGDEEEDEGGPKAVDLRRGPQDGDS